MAGLVEIMRNNPKYLISDAVAFAVSYPTAAATFVYLDSLDLSDATKVGLTFTAKSLSFLISKLMVHGSDYQKLFNSITAAVALKGVFEMGGHYIAMQYPRIPNYLSPIIGYAPAGILATLARYYLDAKSGVLTMTGRTTN